MDEHKAVIVYYNETGLFRPAKVGDRLREVARLDVPPCDTDERAADAVFRAMNRVDGSKAEVVPDGERSMSVGDVILLNRTTALACTVAGWRRCAVMFDPLTVVFAESEQAYLRRMRDRAYDDYIYELRRLADGKVSGPDARAITKAMSLYCHYDKEVKKCST